MSLASMSVLRGRSDFLASRVLDADSNATAAGQTTHRTILSPPPHSTRASTTLKTTSKPSTAASSLVDLEKVPVRAEDDMTDRPASCSALIMMSSYHAQGRVSKCVDGDSRQPVAAPRVSFRRNLARRPISNAPAVSRARRNAHRSRAAPRTKATAESAERRRASATNAASTYPTASGSKVLPLMTWCKMSISASVEMLVSKVDSLDCESTHGIRDIQGRYNALIVSPASVR